MSFVWVNKETPNHRVRQVTVTPQTLEQIADLLGIPQADRGQFVSGTIYIETAPPPSPSGGGAGPSPPSSPPSPPGGGRR
jgi:hypothetical protein